MPIRITLYNFPFRTDRVRDGRCDTLDQRRERGGEEALIHCTMELRHLSWPGEEARCDTAAASESATEAHGKCEYGGDRDFGGRAQVELLGKKAVSDLGNVGDDGHCHRRCGGCIKDGDFFIELAECDGGFNGFFAV